VFLLKYCEATEAVKELARVMVKDRAVIVRRNAAEALGVAASLLTPPQTELTAAFITALKDDDDQVIILQTQPCNSELLIHHN
jgi:HEAT repeat protein